MRRLLLFAKRPLPGRVKTRLARRLGAETACALYRGFLADELARLARFAAPGRGVRVELRADGPGAFDDPAPPPGVPVAEQGPGDFGARLTRAFDAAFESGDGPVVALGADAPTVPDATVDAAFEALERPDVDAAVAPAADGGYVLVGLARRSAAPFRDVPWGAAGVLAATRARCAAAGLALHELPGGRDVDDLADLARLVRDLRRPDVRARAPHTATRVAAQFDRLREALRELPGGDDRADGAPLDAPREPW